MKRTLEDPSEIQFPTPEAATEFFLEESGYSLALEDKNGLAFQGLDALEQHIDVLMHALTRRTERALLKGHLWLAARLQTQHRGLLYCLALLQSRRGKDGTALLASRWQDWVEQEQQEVRRALFGDGLLRAAEHQEVLWALAYWQETVEALLVQETVALPVPLETSLLAVPVGSTSHETSPAKENSPDCEIPSQTP